ncbi:MAG: peptidoglycan DD-metalloendopeptidase family protein [bacterium]|nr:peptidoglycan DD-metalloendopeptidase family protein [bacterium]
MKHRKISYISKAITALIVLGIIFLGFEPALSLALTAEELKAVIDKKSAELEKVNAEIEKTQNTLTATSAYANSLQKQIGTIDKSINQVTLNIRSSELTIDKLALQIASLEEAVEEQERELAAKRAAIGETLRQVQEKDNENLLIVFLKNKSLADGLAHSQSILDLNEGLLVVISDIERIKAQVVQQIEEVSDKKGSKEKESQTLKAKKSIIEDQKAERSSILKSTKNQESAYQMMLAELEKQQQSISNEIDEIEAKLRGEFDSSLIPAPGSGELGYPVASVRITQTYGATAFAQRAYKSKFHNGVDFGASIGTAIMAAEDGEVIASIATTSKLQYGYYILIKHNNNLTTLYAHLSRFAVHKGDTVKRGQVIGYAGNTGYVTGPHLHFVVYAGKVTLTSFLGAGLVPLGATLNPMNYL